MARDVRVILIKLADRTPQHAHPGRRAAREVGPHRLRDAGHLRAHRLPPGPEPDLPRTAGTGVPPPAALALRRADQGRDARAQPPPRPDPEGAEGSRDRLRGSRHGGADRRAREDAVLDLPQDGREAPELRAGHRHLRLSHHRADGDRLLHRPGHAAPALQAGAGQVQGPHRHPQAQRLPVAAHHAGRPLGRERRVPDAHRGHARGGRIRRGRALAVQGQRARQPDHRRAWAPSGCSRCWTSRTRRATPPSSGTTSRSTCSPTRSTSSRPRARSWRCRAAPPWSTSPTPSTATSATAPWPRASTASRCRCAPS